MSIEVKTYVSIKSQPTITPSACYKSKSGVIYPDSLSLISRVVVNSVDENGEPISREDKYVIKILGTAKKEGTKSPEITQLNRDLRTYDYQKYPLQLKTKNFDLEGSWIADLRRFVVTDRNARESELAISAKELLEKVNSPKKS